MIECLLRVATYTRKITFVFGAIVFCLLQGKTQSAGELHHLHREQQAEEQKCLCDMAALHRFLSFIWWQQQKIWSFQKNCHQCSPPPSLARSPSSSMFLQPASCASLPPYPPPITNMTSTQRQPTPPLPFDRTSPSSFICHCRSSPLSLLDHTEGVQSDFVNHFFCSNWSLSGHPGVPAADGGGVARGGGGGGGEHPPQLCPR